MFVLHVQKMFLILIYCIFFNFNFASCTLKSLFIIEKANYEICPLYYKVSGYRCHKIKVDFSVLNDDTLHAFEFRFLGANFQMSKKSTLRVKGNYLTEYAVSNFESDGI